METQEIINMMFEEVQATYSKKYPSLKSKSALFEAMLSDLDRDISMSTIKRYFNPEERQNLDFGLESLNSFSKILGYRNFNEYSNRITNPHFRALIGKTYSIIGVEETSRDELRFFRSMITIEDGSFHDYRFKNEKNEVVNKIFQTRVLGSTELEFYIDVDNYMNIRGFVTMPTIHRSDEYLYAAYISRYVDSKSSTLQGIPFAHLAIFQPLEKDHAQRIVTRFGTPEKANIEEWMVKYFMDRGNNGKPAIATDSAINI